MAYFIKWDRRYCMQYISKYYYTE